MEFARSERNAVLALGVVSGVVIALDHVFTVSGTIITVDYTTGVLLLLAAIAGMIFSVFIHEAAHKYVARSIGYFTHIQSYPPGLVAGGALSFFSFGWLQFYTPNMCDLEADPRARIAKHRKYENWKQEAFIAGVGIFATAVLAIIFHAIYGLTDFVLFRELMLGNIWIMVFSLIPFELLSLSGLRLFNTIEQLPQSDGLYLLHYSIYAWVFFATFALTLGLLLYFFTSPAISIAFLVAAMATVSVWYNMFSGK